jgi:hypothetical protein
LPARQYVFCKKKLANKTHWTISNVALAEFIFRAFAEIAEQFSKRCTFSSRSADRVWEDFF